MRITIITEKDDVHLLEVDSQIELENIKALIEVETRTPANDQILFYHGEELTDPKKTLEEYKVVQDEVLLLKKRNTTTQSTSRTNHSSEAERIRQMILNQPQILEQLYQTQPELAFNIAEAARNNPQLFASLIQQMGQSRREGEVQRINELNADPFDVEAQKKIEEDIRMENINSSYVTASEYYPESFGRVIMLYINVEVNGYPIKAFVDSGAERTFMSHSCAIKCGIMRLIDERYSGIVKGVGTAKIIGRVHTAQLRVGKNMFLPCSLTITEDPPQNDFQVERKSDVDLLFGLDMLKRHQATIDLKTNSLIINGESIPFLPEHEIPNRENEQTDSPGTNSSQLGKPHS